MTISTVLSVVPCVAMSNLISGGIAPVSSLPMWQQILVWGLTIPVLVAFVVLIVKITKDIIRGEI